MILIVLSYQNHLNVKFIHIIAELKETTLQLFYLTVMFGAHFGVLSEYDLQAHKSLSTL